MIMESILMVLGCTVVFAAIMFCFWIPIYIALALSGILAELRRVNEWLYAEDEDEEGDE